MECTGVRPPYSSLAGDRTPEADSKRAGRRPSVLIRAPHISALAEEFGPARPLQWAAKSLVHTPQFQASELSLLNFNQPYLYEKINSTQLTYIKLITKYFNLIL